MPSSLSEVRLQHSPSTPRMPDAFVILFFVILLAGLVAWLVPAGTFDTKQITTLDGSVKTVLDADSFAYVEQHRGFVLFDGSGETTGIANYAFDGMVSGDKWGAAVGVIAFILIVGGAFGIVMQTGAINNGIMALIKRYQHADNLLLPALFLLFSLGGAVFGMGEEAIAFCIVLVPLMTAMGYNGIMAVLVTYVATQIGFATSWMNPFSVAIAQGIADVPLMSGQSFRMTIWGVFTAAGLAFTLRYAKQLKAQHDSSRGIESVAQDASSFAPSSLKSSPSSSLPGSHAQDNSERAQSFSTTDKLILVAFFACICWVMWGVIIHAYYIPQIASQFFCMGIIIGAIAWCGKRMRMNDISAAFVSGAQSLLPAALIVGMAKGIVLVLGGDDVTSPSVLNTLLHHTGTALAQTGTIISAWLMLLFQSIFNFFIASGSGQAAITMPLMAPLSDLVGVTRQVAVLAFQLGDGLTNLVIPTSASLIGCLGVAGVSWTTWVKFIAKFFACLFALASLTVITAVLIGLS
ncbi:putative basic amino acid antiporter YfcC [Alteromonas gracilis]|uniref:putative basic amino acid antiporter YfcC n=1 Tax=Alteromonas gracilis TaxID=1479524 RepID=UPI003218FC2D